jgi:DNA invertase Pin-like site-specific DNA recombinase
MLEQQQIEEIIKQIEQGRDLSEIAASLGLTYHQLWRMLSNYGLKLRANHDDEVVRLVESGYSISYIMKQLNISNAAVSKIYKRVSGVSISDYRRTKRVKYGHK